MAEDYTHLTTFDDEIRERVDTLLQQMTLQEKVGQMNQVVPGRAADLEPAIRNGQIGSLLSITDVQAINHYQKVAVESSRLGIPLLIGNDVVHGYRTIFPIPLAESCTWDPVLLERAARVAADEAAACGTDWIFAPMVDICRDPRWGRIAEGAGEDPNLGSVLACARVRGFQSSTLTSGRQLVACPKHYVAYGAAEAGKDYNTVDVSERTLRDIFLPPFKAAFDEGAGSVMSAFNEISGVPASANSFTLRTVLRQEWGFEDMVVLSDYNAVGELVPHGFAADLQEAARLAALAGVDMDMMSFAYPQYLVDLVQSGQVPEALIDTAVRRILGLKFALGLFDRPHTDETVASRVILSSKYRDLALKVANKSMVLLKNQEGLLPLKEVKRIALIGPLADDHHAALGCWACQGRSEDVESVMDGFRSLLSQDVDLDYIQGCQVESDTTDEIDKAVTAAQSADVAVLVLGESARMSGEARSRAYLDLPGQQQALLDAVVGTGTPVVVVLFSGRPLVLTWMNEHVGAILQAWHGGIRAGRAVVEILLGQFNPSGRLTASFPRTVGQIPVYYAYKSTGRPAQGGGTRQFADPYWSRYIDETNEPLFPFGYGLSYTTYQYTNLQVGTPALSINDTLIVSADVTNTGDCAGVETVQCYVCDLVGSVTRPVKELKGFEQIVLEPGETRCVHFQIPVQELGFHDLDNRYIVEPGEFKVWIGPNAAAGLEGTFQVTVK